MIKRCAACGKGRRIHARGLCLWCYQHPAARAPLTAYPKTGPYHAPRPGTIRRIALELGIARQTVRLARDQKRLHHTADGWVITPAARGRPPKRKEGA